MRARDSAEGWGWVTRLLHWGMAGLILFQLGLGIWMTRDWQGLVTRFELTQTHKSWGVVIFVLALIRLGWRATGGARPALPAALSGWQRYVARVGHVALYVLMIGLPLTGWVQAAAAPEQDLLGIENMVFGRITLPDPWPPGVARIADIAAQVHSSAAWLLLALVLVHIGAALRHHFGNHDRVLARMILGR